VAIVNMLLAECAAAGVDVRVGQRIREVTRADDFRVDTEAGDILAGSVVLATGGLSIPKMGASGLSHEIARRIGLALVPPRPGLVPLTLPPADLARTQTLSGVSLDVTARCGKRAFREAMLFTHRGLSGPAVLQISSYWRDGEVVEFDLLPDADSTFLQARKRSRPKAALRTLLGEAMPQRLADFFVPAEIAGKPAGDVPDAALADLVARIMAWRIVPAGTEGFAKAEVTVGGVDTAHLSSQTMMARDVPKLFVIGEAVDVTGWLGGYNFQWAWASGWAAAGAA
jgi:predicted Rossmann fold flavoprotein